jgi:anti-sigma regulatory factor (Ser/Thr protein kinase)
MASPRTALKLKNDLAEITRLTAELEGFCERNAVSPGSLMALNLALEEIVTNVISYGFDGGDHEIDLELVLDDGTVQATVTDQGKEYDPLQREDPDVDAPLEERRVGGLGVLLVKRLMDDVSYARTGGRNIMTIRKRA